MRLPLADEGIFRSLFAAYPDALLVVGQGGEIVLANPAAAELLGYAADELTGVAVDALVPDGIRPRHAAYRDAYVRNPVPRPMGTHMDLVARRRDGSEVLVEIALSPLHDQGLPYVVAAIRGIGAYPRVRQALKRARFAECLAQFGRVAVDAREPHELMRQAPVAAAEAMEVDLGALFLLEPDGRHCRVAGGVGLTDDEAEGALVPNELDSPVGYLLRQGRAVIVTDYRSETRFVTPPAYLRDGFVSGLGMPLTERGRTVGALVVRSRQPQRFGDDEVRFLESLANFVASTLQRVQGEEELRHAQRLESIGQLTGGIAHDFNNLLTVIHGNLQVLEDLPSMAADEQALQMLGAASRASMRGAELTGKLLAFSRRQVLQPSPVDVGALLHSLADMLRRTLDQRIAIEVDVAPGCPHGLADAGQLESALLNIAINARDAMPEGGPLRFSAGVCASLPPSLQDELTEGLQSPLRAGDYVTIGVTDSGCGMSEAIRERAFEPFFTTKEIGRGTGLGLSTVYGFARQSRGGVAIDSAPGAGTTITLFIPRLQADAAAAERRPGRDLGLPEGLRVMLVEDEPEVLRVALAFLDGWRCKVTACTSGEQALMLLQAEDAACDLLLSDVVLGAGMRGTELAARARERLPGLAVVLMSGYSSDLLGGELNNALQPPPLRLSKPFSRQELATAMATVIARSHPAGAPASG